MPGQKTDIVRTIPIETSMRTPAVWICWLSLRVVLAVFLSTSTVQADFNDAEDAYNRGDYEVAFQEWLLYAAENDSRALYNLGQMYRLGRGVDQNILIAKQYYRRAAALGHIGAHGNLGSMFFSKNPPDFEQAFYHWQIAARGGHARSQYLLGIQYFNGGVTGQNLVLAYAWVTLASNAGLTEAAEAAASMKPLLGEGQIAEVKYLVSTLMAPGVVVARIDQQQPSGPSDAPDNKAAVAGPVVTPEVIESFGSVLGEAEIASRISEVSEQKEASQSLAADPTLAKESEGPYQTQNENLISRALENSAAEVGQDVGRFRVQVAAFRSPNAAETHWGNLTSRHSDLLVEKSHRIAVAELGEKGTLYRLQVGIFATLARARLFCGTLKSLQLDCFVVLP